MYVEGEFAKMWISEGIFYFVYKPFKVIDYRSAIAIVNQRMELQNGSSYPIFCDLREVDNAHKQARDYLSTEGSFLMKALAILVKNEHASAILKMYIQTSMVHCPTAIFTEKNKAIEFLKDYK